MCTIQDNFDFLHKINEANALVDLDPIKMEASIYLSMDSTDKRYKICNNIDDFYKLLDYIPEMNRLGDVDLLLVKNIIKADLDTFEFNWIKKDDKIYAISTKKYEAPEITLLITFDLLYKGE